MPARLVEARVNAVDSARVEAFVRAWNGPSKRSESEAIRALIRLGLEAAAQPPLFDERWLDIEERLARIERLLDALGLCVAANPALTAWLMAQVGHERGPAARERLAENIELLVQSDWDTRCRARGIPRPRHVPRPRRQPSGQPTSTETRKLYRMTLRLPESFRQRIQAFAVREDQPPLAALRRLVQIGINVAEAESWRDEIDRLLESSRRIEVQLDEIGALATGPASVSVHLWRREKDLPEEWEQAVVSEVVEVAEATWMNLLAGPPQPAPPELVGDEDDDGSFEDEV